MAQSDEIVSKSDFAKLCDVSPGRVTQWIVEGKISGEAIVGEGRSAKIRVEVARKQINMRRDVGQALGNGLGTRLATASTVVHEDDGAGEWDGGTDDVDRKLKLSKLEASERANRMAALEEAEKTGLYTETAEVRSEMGRISGQVIRIVEGGLPEMATAIAAHFRLDGREVTHFVNEQFRKVREQAAALAEEAAKALPEFVDLGRS